MRLHFIIAVLALVALFLPQGVRAEGFFHKAETFSMTGTDEPCTSEIPLPVAMAMLREGTDMSKLRQAQVVFDTGPVNACWLRLTPTRVFVVDETGNFGFVDVGVAL